jgi:sn-glycerol 3-phosphate transport system permease protein
MQTKRTIFGSKGLPYLLLAPQLAITAIFFLWPAGQAVYQSFLREDAFGLNTSFVGMRNYSALFDSAEYLNSVQVTVVFSIATVVCSLGISLILALAVDRMLRSASAYTSLLVWPYAVAPAVAGILWWFIFNPSIGILPFVLEQTFGYDWNHNLTGSDAMILVVIASVWKQISYNFLFFVAGLQSIPASLREAAAIDGAGPFKRLITITLPLLSPTTFFLLVVNVVYTLFDTFAVIHATTSGGPAQATNTLVYNVFDDGFVGLNLGSSAAQSVVLMCIVMLLTFVQFRYVERRVTY